MSQGFSARSPTTITMRILPLSLLAWALTTATPITTQIMARNTGEPLLPGDCVLASYGPLHLNGLQTLSPWHSAAHGEILTQNAAGIPEPKTLLPLAGGLLVAAGMLRKKRRRQRSTIGAQQKRSLP